MEAIQNFINADAWSSIVPIVMKSIDAIELLKVMNPKIWLLYLDGDHTMGTVLKELSEFDRFIQVGGFICGDDCTLLGNYYNDTGRKFNNVWAEKDKSQLCYVKHDYGAGVSSAVWEFFSENSDYEVLPHIPGNQFGFRKLK